MFSRLRSDFISIKEFFKTVVSNPDKVWENSQKELRDFSESEEGRRIIEDAVKDYGIKEYTTDMFWKGDKIELKIDWQEFYQIVLKKKPDKLGFRNGGSDDLDSWEEYNLEVNDKIRIVSYGPVHYGFLDIVIKHLPYKRIPSSLSGYSGTYILGQHKPA